jgi:hypothetical protein
MAPKTPRKKRIPAAFGPVLPKNSIRQFCGPIGRTSNLVTAERVAGEKPEIPRIRVFHHRAQTGSAEQARQAVVQDHAAREYR